MKFSERMGYNKPRLELQKDSMDENLANGIYNCLMIHIFQHLGGPPFLDLYKDYRSELIESLWLDFFKKPIDSSPEKYDEFIRRIKAWFFNAKWYEIYEFTEFIIENHKNKMQVKNLIEELNNKVLKRELSAYRIISTKFTPITSDVEIAEIEEAIDSPVKGVSKHLIRAQELLSDRKNPDYRNSIKESISAVETICKIISENPKGKLGDAISILKKKEKMKFHGAILVAFEKLYGYTSDAEGIRHSLMEEESLDQEDASFMLVSCSAFVNYLTVKTLKSSDNFPK